MRCGSYNDGEVFREPIVCWAFVADRPYLENGADEERSLEGMVVITLRTSDFLGYL